MTDYFLLTQGKDLVHPVTFSVMEQNTLKPSLTNEEFERLDSVMIAYFDNNEGIEIPDILINPTFMVSTKIKQLFELYDEEVRFKGLQLYSTKEEDQTAPFYWIPNFPCSSCLHAASTKYGTGMLKELVLDQGKIEGKDLFRVGELIENRVIISLAVAESLLRRELMGIGLEEVKVR